MKRMVVACVWLALAGPGVLAGVVVEMETDRAGTDTMYADGTMLRIDPQTGASTIFRDDTLWIVDHDKKQCRTIDAADLRELSARLGGAMKEMQAQLAQLPPEQRAMMEKMMREKMPGMAAAAPPRRIVAGGSERVGSYACTVHTLVSGEDKVWEVCAADESAVEAFSEAKEAFEALSGFVGQLREAVQQMPFVGAMDTPFSEMDRVDGVPVRVRTFRNGKTVSESTLKSVTRRELDASTFAVPPGYKVEKLVDDTGAGRRR